MPQSFIAIFCISSFEKKQKRKKETRDKIHIHNDKKATVIKPTEIWGTQRQKRRA